MTKKKFEGIKKAGIEKWQRALDSKDHETWWKTTGVGSCSFCAYFYCDWKLEYLAYRPTCPLMYEHGCAEPWRKLYENKGYKTKKAFMKYATQMLQLIEAVEYKEEWDNN